MYIDDPFHYTKYYYSKFKILLEDKFLYMKKRQLYFNMGAFIALPHASGLKNICLNFSSDFIS